VTPESLLRELCLALNAAKIPFMITGSMAASWHGAGRATLDVDLIIDPSPTQLDALMAALERPGLYVEPESARRARDDRTMFNIIDINTGWKADLIFRKEREFSQVEFDRRVAGQLDDVPIWVTAVEDLILAKLEWAHLGGSTRQLEDVASLLAVSGPSLDTSHVERWAARLGVTAEWRAASRLPELDHD
jgi:hypothetical protein